MKMKKKRALFIALALATVFSSVFLTGCTKKDKDKELDDNGEDVEATYLIDEFLLGTWKGYYGTNVKSYEEQTREMAEAGLNFQWFPYNAAPTRPSYEEIEDIYSRYGMKYLYDVSGWTSVYNASIMPQLENCVGYFLKDEPKAEQIPSLKDNYAYYYNEDLTRRPFVNLYPSYAPEDWLSGSYSDYVNNWVNSVGAEKIEYLYYDHYPFLSGGRMRSTYFSDMETIRKVAYTNGRMKTGAFSQTGWWVGMQKPTANEVRWNLNTFIAYGFKSISHFCWVSPNRVSVEDGGEDMRDHVIDQNGNKTELYDPLVQYNWEIRQLGDLLMGIDCEHAYHSGSYIASGVETLPKDFFIQPQNKSTNYIISFFKAKKGGAKYVMIMNNSMRDNKTGKFTIDANANITSLTKYSTTIDENNLPDPTNLSTTLGALKEDTISLSAGYFEETFLPGEVKIYKVNYAK